MSVAEAMYKLWYYVGTGRGILKPGYDYTMVAPPGMIFRTAAWDARVADLFESLGDKTLIYDRDGHVPVVSNVVMEHSRLLQDCIAYWLPSFVIETPTKKGGYGLSTLFPGRTDGAVPRGLQSST